MMGARLPTEAQRLLDEIDRWTAATQTSGGQLGQMVLNHGGFVPLLRKRGSLTAETATRIRAFMAAFPDSHALPPALIARLATEARGHAPWTPERHRSMLIRLGYPSHPSFDLAPNGGGQPPALKATGETAAVAATETPKPRISAAVIRAAKLDGRDLPVFVTALIDMGLECWRDDRVMHGEAVS